MLDAFFLPVEPGRRFCVLNRPGVAPRRAVVYVHPFADEMNKARRMAALQAHRLAAAGCAVLRMDFLGCGDSSGEFIDARWDSWKRDVQAAVGWLRERFAVPVTLWGLRLGAALATEIAQHAEAPVDHLLLWQPVSTGSQFLSQFLRLRLASEMLASGAATTALRELTAELAKGNTLEIAGYELHPELATAIERIRLDTLRPAVKRVDWMEVAAERELPLRPASRRVIDTWRACGLEVRTSQAAGEPFWSTIEIAESAELLALTGEAMECAP